jgi:hypothetical protein
MIGEHGRTSLSKLGGQLRRNAANCINNQSFSNHKDSGSLKWNRRQKFFCRHQMFHRPKRSKQTSHRFSMQQARIRDDHRGSAIRRVGDSIHCSSPEGLTERPPLMSARSRIRWKLCGDGEAQHGKVPLSRVYPQPRNPLHRSGVAGQPPRSGDRSVKTAGHPALSSVIAAVCVPAFPEKPFAATRTTPVPSPRQQPEA